MLKPSKGRIVLFCNSEDPIDQSPAIVTHVGGDGTIVDLQVFERSQALIKWGVPHSETPATGAWTWPPKTKEFV